MVLDLSTLDTVKASEDGVPLEVRHPTTGAILENGSGGAVTLVLAGSDSDRAKRAERATINRRLKMAGRRTSTMTAEELDSDALEILAACTLSWSGFSLDGQELECNAQNAKRLYGQIPWLREQAEAFRQDRSNFLKASSTG
jgi:hypothetical protein